MPRYYDEYNRPLSYEEAFRRASASLGTPQVFNESGDLVKREDVLEDLGWRFGSAGARAITAAKRATFFGFGAIGCLAETTIFPLLTLVIVNVHVYRVFFWMIQAVGAFLFVRLLRESPPRVTSMMALIGSMAAGYFVLKHFLPYPELFVEDWRQIIVDPPDHPYPAIYYLPLLVWYFFLVRAAYYYVADDGWAMMIAVLFLAGLPGALIQSGWDPLVVRPAWAETVAALLPESAIEKQARLAAVTPTPTTVATGTPLPAAATPQPTPTPITIQIANTGGAPAYLFRSPKVNDRLDRPYPPGTRLTIARPEIVQGDGVEWLQVRTPDGALAYLPRQFAAPAP